MNHYFQIDLKINHVQLKKGSPTQVTRKCGNEFSRDLFPFLKLRKL